MGFLRFFGRGDSALQHAKARAQQRSLARGVSNPGKAARNDDSAPVVLGSHAVAWADGLPPELRPVELMRRYPRVANRLALCWADRILRHNALEDLLIDRRGGRQGFPARVREELVRLRIAYPVWR
jgi:hypothetical protein